MNVLILGASYGSLLATKLLLAGHEATLVCTAATAALVNERGTVVRLPLKGRDEPVEISSRTLPGKLRAAVPDEVRLSDDASDEAPSDEAASRRRFDLVVLAMQEPQYGSEGVRELLGRIARAGLPTMAIMNMPPKPYLARLPGIDADALDHCYAEPALWADFEPSRITLASPDPQAFRPPEEDKNVLQVSLPTNFKVARFGDEGSTDGSDATALLRTLQDDIRAVRHALPDGTSVELPVHVAVFDSLYVPLAKWAMLIAGNYACVREAGMVSIREAVHADLARSRETYEWVCRLCERLGAAPGDMVPFEKYARAAEGLAKPSSAARALAGGATAIERVDALVQGVAAQRDMRNETLDRIVARVDARLARNRAEAG